MLIDQEVYVNKNYIMAFVWVLYFFCFSCKMVKMQIRGFHLTVTICICNGSVQQIWDTINDRVIGLHNDHVTTIHTGGRKWKSNYPHDKEVLGPIREAWCHRFWVTRQPGLEGQSARPII